MKKTIFLLCALFLSVIIYAQENQSNYDSIHNEVQKVIKNADDLIDKSYRSKNMHKSRSLDELSKQDLKKYKIEYDKFSELNFIYPKNRRGFSHYPYLILTNSNRLMMKLRMRYFDNRWGFIEKIELIIDEEKYLLHVSDSDRNIRGGGYVEEILHIEIDDKAINVIEKIAKTKSKVDIKYVGKINKTGSLSGFDRMPFTSIYDLYENLVID